MGAEPPAAGGYGSLEAKRPAAGQFFGKNGYFNATESHLARFQSHLKKQNF